ncbi:thermonuclease family protein [Pleomorphomonas sp. JP5]|uniref:thermonuclease family protein n=1 Tax=Pleomorphomonas sp. JP5 TaxID=2942998 RepID=UPI002043B1A9|nr:thermonuclease family protein [Pleomorphomonas sp. JP5]MCM5558471.1 thermonuclease family protein [Pleomorphomonas sp. JP5]
MVGFLVFGVLMAGAAAFETVGDRLSGFIPASLKPSQAAESTVYERSFSYCSKISRTCVVDGDTIWLDGTKIRIADIDTPELSPPRCAYERELGERAKARLRDLLNVGPFTLRKADRDEDRYGRKLRTVHRADGRSIGLILVDEGLAREWDGARHPWCS